jgi:hypothetical protein
VFDVAAPFVEVVAVVIAALLLAWLTFRPPK